MSDELSEIAALIREHLAYEEATGNLFLPRWTGEARPAQLSEAASVSALDDPPAPVRARTSATMSASAPSASAVPPVERLPSPPSPSVAPAPAAPARVASGEKRVELAVLAERAASCTACGLHKSRTKSVFARGSADATVVFVGEGPGYNEDQEGVPFVGAAGQLLDKMIEAMGLGPDELYVCNVVKCRPPDNRTPLPDEAGACSPFLNAQLELVGPKVIVALGRVAAESLGCAPPTGRWRGVWGESRGVPVMPTYHPAYLLRSPEQKKPVWEDLQGVLTRLGRTAPARKS
jgi:uracil-DNA glycosylase